MSSNKELTFYKFLSPTSAAKVLNTSTVRWSSPERLQDPFELTSKSGLGFDANSLLDSTIKLSSSMIFAPEKPKGDSPLLNAINRWREEERFDSADEAHGVLRELLGKMVDYRLSQLESSMSLWQAHIRNSRICCLSSKVDNVVCWERFAKNHTGVALRFESGEHSPFNNGKPVIYQTERPEFTTIREQLGAILHNRKDQIIERFDDHHLLKAPHHKQESEYRCYRKTEKIVPIDNDEADSWYDDVPFQSKDLTAVYLGLTSSDEMRASITALTHEKYRHAKIYQTVKAKAGFNLEFEKIS